MRLMQIKSENNRWGFTGASIPMELARKTWPDKYAAVRAAEKAGFVVMANGSCVSDTEPAARVKSEDNLPTRPLDKWHPIERFNYIGESGGLCRIRRVGDCEPLGKMVDADTAARVVLCWNTLKDLGQHPHLEIGNLCICLDELIRALRTPGDPHDAEIGRAMKALASVGYVKPVTGKGAK